LTCPEINKGIKEKEKLVSKMAKNAKYKYNLKLSSGSNVAVIVGGTNNLGRSYQ
jgi:hypothetical protein